MAASNVAIAPPSLRRKAATDNMLQIIKARPNWPVCADVFEYPPPRLASRRPIWLDMTSVDTVTQWREDWSSASVVSHTIVTRFRSRSTYMVSDEPFPDRSRPISCSLAQMGSRPITFL